MTSETTIHNTPSALEQPASVDQASLSTCTRMIRGKDQPERVSVRFLRLSYTERFAATCLDSQTEDQRPSDRQTVDQQAGDRQVGDQQREYGIQPIAAILEQLNLKPHDLVEASTEQLTHKMVSRAVKGRRLTSNTKGIVQRALNRAAKRTYSFAELFNY